MKISQHGLELIAGFEKFVAKPYLDTGKVPTIGYGTTIYPDGRKVTMKDAPITKQQALQYKMYHIEKRCYPYMKELALNQNQFDAICSFIYNMGGGAFMESTLRKKIIANASCDEITAQFMRWDKDNGEVLAGLVKRRKIEAELFCKPVELNTDKP